MGDVKAWRTRIGSPLIVPFYVQAGQTLRWGDIVCVYDETLVDRVGKPTATELAADNKGVLGFCWHDTKVDSSGILQRDVPSTVDSAAAVVHPVFSFTRLMHRPNFALAGSGEDIGIEQIQVCVFTDDLEVEMWCCGAAGAATTVQLDNQGIAYDLLIDSGDSTVKVNLAATSDPMALITEVDTHAPNFNTSADNNNSVWVRLVTAYQQYTNNQKHAT